MIYRITYKNYLEQLAVTAYADRATADARLNAVVDPSLTGFIVETAGDIAGSKNFMIDLYNALGRSGDTPLGPTGFNNRATGAERVFERLDQYYKNLPVITADPRAAEEQPAPTEPSMAEPLQAETPQQEGADMATKKKRTKKSAAEKKPRAHKPDGAGRPVRRNSSLGKILEFIIDGDFTKDQIAKKLALRPDQVMHRIGQVLRVNNGIGHKVSADGKIKAILPEGFNKNTIFKDKAE